MTSDGGAMAPEAEAATAAAFEGPGDGGPELLADPAGYVLAWSPGLQAAVAAADDAAAAELLLGAQAACGVPPAHRSPWTPAECEALVEEWLTLEADHAGAPGLLASLARARARIGFLRTHVLALPPAPRAAAKARLETLGLDGRRPGLLRAIAEALERGNLVQAYSHALQGAPGADPER